MTRGSSPSIGIDGYNLALPQGTGVATYARNLGIALNHLSHPVDLIFGLQVPESASPELRESLFFARLGQDDGKAPTNLSLKGQIKRALTLPGARRLIEIPVADRVIATELLARLPPFDRIYTRGSLFRVAARYYRHFGKFMTVKMENPPAIMHWTYPLPIRLHGAANVYTLHDLVPLRLPQTTLEDKRYYQRLIAECLKTADRICTVSENSRNDILKLFPKTPPEKVFNTYQAAIWESDLGDRADVGRRLARLFDLDYGEYFLFFAAIEPKKNLGRLIEAYLTAEIDRPFVIVGKEAWQAEQELSLLRGAHGGKLKNAERIRRIDYLPRSQLALLVKGARAVCMPSLYEGFGLPALEAMIEGTPVLASSTGSLPEIVGSDGLTVDPYDVRALAAALERLDRDEEFRLSLAAFGHRQAEKFSMVRYQDRLQQLYNPLIERNS